PARAGQAAQHALVGGVLVEMHRLRVEFGGKRQNLLARDMTRPERAERARRKIFEGEGHGSGIAGGRSDCGRTLRQSQPVRPHGSCSLWPGLVIRPQVCVASRIWARLAPDSPWGKTMFDFQDLFQWDRFITPTIIKTFYWLIIALICLLGISGIFSGLAAMAISPFAGFLVLLSSIASVIVGIVFSRIAAEFILIVFRINEHLGAIRDQGGLR